jgi:protein arginine N-methyltransferase 1
MAEAAFLDHTPRGHASRYVSSCYLGMRDDIDRTEAYRKAIEEMAPGKIVLDMGTGALALLAMIAARAGAAHVYAIEVPRDAAEAAKAAVAAAGLTDRVTVLHAFSTDASLELPVKAELMVHELVGEIGGEEGVCMAVLDAAARHMAASIQPPLSIPSRTRTLCSPCEYPDSEFCATLPPTALESPGSARALKLLGLPPSTHLAPPQAFEDLRFETGAPVCSQCAELHFEATRDGLFRGLAVHVELHVGAMGGEEPPDVSSACPGSHWRNILLLLSDHGGIKVRAGAAIRVKTTAVLGGPQPRYTFEAWVDGKSVGEALHYPEASLSINDMADFLNRPC